MVGAHTLLLVKSCHLRIHERGHHLDWHVTLLLERIRLWGLLLNHILSLVVHNLIIRNHLLLLRLELLSTEVLLRSVDVLRLLKHLHLILSNLSLHLACLFDGLQVESIPLVWLLLRHTDLLRLVLLLILAYLVVLALRWLLYLLELHHVVMLLSTLEI